tara:strand:+ start:978 stop:1352 length:375 start_codon:yes stop_codon:yes gene_type:complete
VSTFDAYAYPPSAGVASAVAPLAAIEADPEPEAEAEAEATADAELEPEADPELEPEADPELEPDADAELELDPEPDELSELSRSLTAPPSSSPQLAATKLNTAIIGKTNKKYFLDLKIPPFVEI